VIFFNILAYNALVIWMALNPDWNRGKLQKRRLSLKELGKALVRPQIQRRQHIPRTPASAAIVMGIQEDAGAPSVKPTEPTTPISEVSVSDVVACVCVCLTPLPYVSNIPELSVFLILDCRQKQQEAL
jgi:hypothetical protein